MPDEKSPQQGREAAPLPGSTPAATPAGQSSSVLAAAGGDDRYNPRGLTALWLAMLARKSAHTRRSYEHALTLWMTYCAAQDVHPLEARRADVDDWILSLGGKAASTVNTYQAGVRSWYRYLRANGATEADPVGAEHRQPVERDVTHTASLTPDETGRLLDFATRYADQHGTETAVRNAAMLRLMLTTAVRSGPVLDATFDDLYSNRGHRVVGYRNKGGKRHEAVLTPFVTVMLDRYHQLRADRHDCRRDELTGRVFVSAPYRGKGGDKRLDSKSLGEMLRRYADSAGIESSERLVPHSTRHTTITSAHEAGVPAHKVKDLAGHADPRMTELYRHGKNRLDDSPAYRMAAFISEYSHYHPTDDQAARLDGDHLPGQAGVPLPSHEWGLSEDGDQQWP